MENYKYKVDVEITRQDLFDYMMHRTYTNAGIIFPLIFAVAALWQAYSSFGTVPMSHTVIYTVIGLLFLFGIPVNVYFRSVRMMGNAGAMLNRPYYFGEEGIASHDESTDGEATTLKWEDIHHIVSTKRCVIVFVNKRMSFMLPKTSMGEKYEEIKNYITEKMPPYTTKFAK